MTLRLAVTPGEPAGIGPDIMVKLAQKDWPVELVVCADPNVLADRAAIHGDSLKLIPYNPDIPAQPQQAGTLTIRPFQVAETVVPGQLNEANGAYVVETLKYVCEQNMLGNFSAIVTGPVHKEIINRGGTSFSGHTEFFALHSNTPDVVMMLTTEGLRVALATSHIPLAYVSRILTQERLEKVITILHQDLQQKFGIDDPAIYLCGLNPHAGEGGHLGKEEQQVIIPVIEKLKAQGLQLTGPLPADTLFQKKYLDHADAVLAMYHDQGLPVLKYKGFGKAMNITLGLPFIRTSVDHGTALDLVGTNEFDCGSFELAIHEAITLVTNSRKVPSSV